MELGADPRLLVPAPASERVLGPAQLWERLLVSGVTTVATSGLRLRIFRRQFLHAKSPLQIERDGCLAITAAGTT